VFTRTVHSILKESSQSLTSTVCWV